MLVNKIQCPEDVSAFVRLPLEQMDEILRDTPEYLLDTIAKLVRGLMYSMNLSEKETEDAVSKIKERKVARLFENVKMDIQAERRERAEAEKRLDEAEQKLDAVRNAYGIYRLISRMLRKNASESDIKKSLMQTFHLTDEQAWEEYRKVLEEE